MKAWIQTTPDFEYEVDDVILCIEDGENIITTWITGFDDVDWEKAVKFAEDLAKTLNIEYIGEVGEADHGLNHIDEGKEE